MSNPRYFRVDNAAGAFLDTFHYAKGEIIAYEPAENEEILWGTEVDSLGNPLPATPKAQPNDLMSDALAKKIGNAVADGIRGATPNTPNEFTGTAGHPVSAHPVGYAGETGVSAPTRVVSVPGGKDATQEVPPSGPFTDPVQDAANRPDGSQLNAGPESDAKRAELMGDVRKTEGDVTPPPAGAGASADLSDEDKVAQIKTAADMFDHDNDEQWTATGLPKVDVLNDLLGFPVTRAEVEAAAPDFKRNK